MKINTLTRLFCAILSLCLLCGGLVACSQGDEVPEGYQDATCNGEYFRLYIPTQWTTNTESGVSGGYGSLDEGAAVSMMEVDFVMPAEMSDSAEEGTTAEGATDADSETNAESETAPADKRDPLTAFAESHVAQVSGLPDFKLLKGLSDTQVNRLRAKEIRYTAKVGETTYGYRQVMMKVKIQEENRYFLFTYSAIYNTEKLKELELGADAISRWDDTVQGILENIVFYAFPYEGGKHAKKTPAVKDVPDGMKLVTGNDVAYRFFAPSDWIIGEATAAALVYASETDRSNVSVMGYVPEAESYSVADYWADTEKYYKANLTDYALTGDPAESTMGGKNATVYEYTYSLGGVTYKCRQTVCVYGYMIVVMTYTALPENYDAHMVEVEAMQGALTFRTPVIG